MLDSGASVWAEGEADEGGGNSDTSKAPIHDLILLLRAILAQVGLLAQKLDSAEVVRALNSAFAFIAGAHGAGALASPVPVGTGSWGANGQRWVGLASFGTNDAKSVLWLTLNAPRHPVTVQPSVSGTAKWRGREYVVRGSYKQPKAGQDGNDVQLSLTLESEDVGAISFSGTVKKSGDDATLWDMECSSHGGVHFCKLFQVPGTGAELNVCVGEGAVEVDGGAVFVAEEESEGQKVFLIQTTQPASPSNNYIQVFHLHSDFLSSRPSFDVASKFLG